jgi:hypothetical protein
VRDWTDEEMKIVRYAAGGVFTGIVLAAMHCAPGEGDGGRGQAAEAVAATTAADTAPCSSPKCDQQSRKCEFTDGTTAGTLCGACVTGTFANAAGACEPIHHCSDASAPCPHQQCADQNGTAPAVCLPSCDAGYVVGGATGKCRPVKTCTGATPLTCTGGTQCIDATTSDGGSGQWVPPPGQDAVCECPAGQGLDPTTGQCASCGDGDTTQCSASPGTSSGRVIFLGAQNGCGCEVPDNYFESLGNTVTPCDADGDGWVTAKAEAVLEESSTPAFYRALARCHVRRASSIVLHADDGTATPEDVTANTGNADLGIPVGLPLYEDESIDDPNVTGRPYVGAVVNAFTKACVLGSPNDPTQSDFNSNGILDVHEGLGSDVVTALASRNLPSKMQQYYSTYLQYAYFLELHNGWYSETTSNNTTVGTYHIAERRRIDAPASAATGIGVALTDTASADTGNYWKECPRGPDVLAAANPKLPGYDFASVGTMNHHSQFKCVDLVDGMTEYNTNEAIAPEVVGITTVSNSDNTTYGWALTRKDKNNTVKSYGNWSVKTCAPTGTIPPADTLSPTNPSSAAIQCGDGFGSDNPTTKPPPRDVARWIVVDGIQADGGPTAPYDRGCVNLCDTAQNGGCTGYTVCLHVPTSDRPTAPNGYPSCGCPSDYNGDGLTAACSCPAGTTDVGHPGHCSDIDECAAGYSPKFCSSPQYCHNLVASKTQPTRAECLNCSGGYRSNGDEDSCSPINLCSDRNPSAQCNGSEYCQYTGPGTSNCGICPLGVASDGFTCNGPQQCYDGYCSNRSNSHCAEYSWGWNCDCNAGYSWNGSACVLPNPCAGVRCQAHATCSGGTCSCTAPYHDDGEGTCINFNPCPCGGVPGHCKTVCGPHLPGLLPP